MIFNQRIGGAGGAAAGIFAYGETLQGTDTVYAEKGSRRVNGVWKQKVNPAFHGLPSGYTELEYIESTGTQYIDTGYEVNNGNVKITADLQLLESPTLPRDYFFFASKLNDSSKGGIWVEKYIKSDTWSWYVRFSSTTSAHIDGFPLSTEFDRHIISLSKEDFSVDGVLTLIPTYAGTFQSSNLTLFGKFNSTSGAMVASAMRYWSFKIMDGANLVRDFIPCINPLNVVGMYDIVNGVFYTTPNNTGTFTAGDIVPKDIYGFEISPIREYGTWMLTASSGTTTKTIDVLIDAAEEFGVEVTA